MITGVPPRRGAHGKQVGRGKTKENNEYDKKNFFSPQTFRCQLKQGGGEKKVNVRNQKRGGKRRKNRGQLGKKQTPNGPETRKGSQLEKARRKRKRLGDPLEQRRPSAATAKAPPSTSGVLLEKENRRRGKCQKRKREAKVSRGVDSDRTTTGRFSMRVG